MKNNVNIDLKNWAMNYSEIINSALSLPEWPLTNWRWK
jgi:hypothetical protein